MQLGAAGEIDALDREPVFGEDPAIDADIDGGEDEGGRLRRTDAQPVVGKRGSARDKRRQQHDPRSGSHPRPLLLSSPAPLCGGARHKATKSRGWARGRQWARLPPMSDIEPHAVPITSLPWMSEAATRAVMAALGDGNARFVGGCVRDALLGRPVLDIDIATKLPPDEVTRRLEAAGIRAVPTGLAHGTVTAVLKPRHFEITTLRRDVETFGRHARVAFTDDWAEDAGRRDFTMNALYLGADGAVFDPIGGLADLRTGYVRFVGDAGRRIDEDVLRLLRFYRFYAHYGKGEADEAARDAARERAPLLPSLSAERVAAEMLKLLAAPDPLPVLALMREDGVLAQMLPEATAFDR